MYGEHVACFAVECLRPKVRTVCSIHKLNSDAKLVSGFANAAANDRRGLGGARFTASRVRYNANLLKLCERVDNFFADALAKISHVSVRAAIPERKNRYRVAAGKSRCNIAFETRRAPALKQRSIAALGQFDSYLFMPAFLFVIASQSRAQTARLDSNAARQRYPDVTPAATSRQSRSGRTRRA